MSDPPLKMTPLSYEEYLEFENAAEERHIFWDGEIFAMSGASENHNTLETTLVVLLFNALSGRPCQPSTGNRRFRSPARNERAVYADAAVICGRPEHHPQDKNATSNPTIIFEVLSDSTEAFDRGKKYAYYRSFPSIRSVVLLSQHEKRIEHFHRVSGGDAWTITELGAGQSLELPDVGVSLPVDEIYQGVELPGEE